MLSWKIVAEQIELQLLVIHKENDHLLIPVAFVDIYANFGWFNAIFENLACLHVFEKLHGAKRRI